MIEDKVVRIIKRYAKPMQPIPTGLKKRGALRSSVRAVVFDVYGTLFVSGSGDISVVEKLIVTEELGRLLRNYGYSADPELIRDKYFDEIKGVHDSKKRGGVDYPEVVIEDIWRRVLDFSTVDRAMEFAAEYESIFNPVWPMPQAGELLAELHRRGLILGIVSNAQFFTPLLFHAFFGKSPTQIGFNNELALYSYVYGYAKPSLFLFQKAREVLEQLGIDSEQTLYVGNDMLNDIFPARTVGFQTALFAGDRRSMRVREDDDRLRGIIPDITVIDLGDISDYIDV
jgi:putative hydrolase of the HAD superfamily